MDKLVIEYNSFQNKKIARALEKAVVAVLEQYHVDKVYMGHYMQYVPGKRLFAYVGEADRINYDEIVDMLYNKLTERPDVDMCGPESAEALRQIGNLLDQQTYMDMEYRITAGFEENAEEMALPL
ncbi:hypothetical protein [uncultured Alistipes sp.]|uniref:hypothetical protein n=1 Tax=uncultured Alistipes sp. TaxID=538949 RepID=UPI0032200879